MGIPFVGSRVAAEVTSVKTMQWCPARGLARKLMPLLVLLRPAKIELLTTMGARSHSTSLAQRFSAERSANSRAQPSMATVAAVAVVAVVDARSCTDESANIIKFFFQPGRLYTSCRIIVQVAARCY